MRRSSWATPLRFLFLGPLFLPVAIATVAAGGICAAEPAAPPAGADCEICEGEGKIVCPRCAGKGKYCKACRNQEKGPCEACRGKGEAACAQCKGLPSTTCAVCAGRGEVWVPRKRIWGKEGLRKVVQAHWETCGACQGKGDIPCRACGGRATVKCKACAGKGSAACKTCGGKEKARPLCAACKGARWIPCPCRGERGAEPPGKDSPAVVSAPALEELHDALRSLPRAPPVVPLLGVARAAAVKSPLAIVVLREALLVEETWVKSLALQELRRFGEDDLAQVGGAGLVQALRAAAAGREVPIGADSEALLKKLAKRYPKAVAFEAPARAWKFNPEEFPEGQGLPPLPGAPRTSGEEAGGGPGGKVVAEPGGKTVVGPGPAPAEGLAGPYFGAEELGRTGLDLIWLIDATGSVRLAFRDMAASVALTTRILSRLLGNVRTGLVAYRDGVEAKLPLSEDPDALVASLKRVRADKGGDFPEAVDIAWRAAVDEKAMKWREHSAVAIVVIGDRGPPGRRGDVVLRNVQDLRGRIPRVKVHCLKVGEAVEFEGPARFWHDLAEAGAGEILSLGTEADAVKDLCGTIPPGIPAGDLHRIIRAILRVEEEKREFRRARGVSGY